MPELIVKPTELSHKEKLEIRNKEICQKYMDWYDQDLFKIEFVKDLLDRLSKEYDLTHAAMYLIFKANYKLLEFHKGWEKHKRVTELKRLRADKVKSNKDVVDIIEQERKEIEGDKPLVDQSIHNHKTFIYLDKKAVEENAASNRVASQLSAEQV